MRIVSLFLLLCLSGFSTAEEAQRPQLQFINYLQESVTVHWIPEQGEPRKAGSIEPGRTLDNQTTIGHRFEIKGDKSDFQRIVVVDSPKRSVVIKKIQGPNFVVLMADDWSYPHASCLGDSVVQTPTFDRIAKEGVLFSNAFVSTPSCTPSRMSIASGQDHWRLNEADSLGGSLAANIPVYPEMLESAGYRIGFARKGASPSQHTYRQRDPFGPRYKSFDTFLEDRSPGEPFCFWLGSGDPHRAYRWKSGIKSGIDLDAIDVPACFPDNETVRTDLADYYWAIQRYDAEAKSVISKLEELDELENTIMVMAGDNGLPFPRCKATLYDTGVRVPLAIRWGSQISQGITVDDFVNLTDLAPTFLKAAGLVNSIGMTGQSLLPQLQAKSSGMIDSRRDHVIVGMEKHVYPYPARAIRNSDFLYIKNFNPQAWPSGKVKGKLAHNDFTKTPWPTTPGSFSFNVDPSPTKQWMLENLNAKDSKLHQLAFGKRPTEELYDLKKDPDQLNNVAKDPAYQAELKKLSKKLIKSLKQRSDPRVLSKEELAMRERNEFANQDEYEITAPPVSMNLAPFYKKYISANGYPVVSSEKVDDYALKEAAFLINMMLAERPDVRKAMIASGSRLIIMAHDEYTTDMPEHAHMKPKDWWNIRARGLGGSRTDPVCSCGEENLLAFEGDPYSTENIFIHEFAHNIHLRGVVNVDVTFDDRLQQTYQKAMDAGLWKGKYASVNKNEYYAEGVQSWFNNNRQPDHDHNHVDTRQELRDYDPGLAALCEEVFGSTKLVYTKPTSRLTGHMSGYDPAKSPKFAWPEGLMKIREEIRREASERGKKK
ncbi:MAG: sulfatase-like hydrolase/transferase [Pirellulales bacterium]